MTGARVISKSSISKSPTKVSGPDALILAAPAEHLLSQVEQMGGDVCATLRHIGLDENAVDPFPPLIPLDTFVALTQQAAVELSRSDLGWVAGQSYDITTLGPVGHALLTADTVGASLAIFCDALHTVQGVSKLTLRIEHNTAVLRYRILDPAIWPRGQDAELTLSVLTALIRLSAGSAWRPEKLVFEHTEPCGQQDNNHHRVKSKVVYGAESNELHFSPALLPLLMPDRCVEKYREYSEATIEMMRTITAQISLPSLVRQKIYLRFGTEPLDQESIARELGLSNRSLRRQLASYGTSYSRELAECRYGLAKRLLLNSNLSIAEIAHELGYSDQTAFERAFRRAFGQTPTQFRKGESEFLSVI